MTDSEEKKLISRARQGDMAAFDEIVRTYDQRVMALAFQFLGNKQDAEDVCQDVFIRVYRNLHQFRHKSEFYTWLYRIVVNSAISYRKKKRRHMHNSLDSAAEDNNGWSWEPADTEADPERLLKSRELHEHIQNGLDHMPVMQRVVFTLRFYEDFKISEIAEITGCAVGTVKNYLFRSTRKMRTVLTPLVDSGE